MPGLALIALLACGHRPEERVTWRERWEILGLPEDGGVVDVVASVGNTDLLRGQGHLHMDFWPASSSPVLLGRDTAPMATQWTPERDSVVLGTDRLARQKDGAWMARFSDLEANSRVTVRPDGDALPPATWSVGGGQWGVEVLAPGGALAGWTEAGKQGGSLVGRAVVLHRGGDGLPRGERVTVVLEGRGVSAGLDREAGGGVAWAQGRALAQDDIKLQMDLQGRTTVDFRPQVDLWAALRLREAGGLREPSSTLLGPERWLYTTLGLEPPRALRRALAEVHVGADTWDVPALILLEGPDAARLVTR